MSEDQSSDRDVLKVMLDRARVVWDESDAGLTISSDDGPNNEGWAGFVAIFTFDDGGMLKNVGVWE